MNLDGCNKSCILSVDTMAEDTLPDYKGFGVWLKEARDRAELSQDELAERTEIGKQHISKLENATPHSTTGKPPMPALDTLFSITQALKVSIVDALEAYGFHKKAGILLSPREEKAIRNLRKLPVNHRELFLDILQHVAARQARPGVSRPGADGDPKTGTDE